MGPPTLAGVDRRRLLVLGGFAGLGAVTGCSDGSSLADEFGESAWERAYCVPRGSLEPHTKIGGLLMVYEVTRSRSRLFFEPGFFTQLQAWLDFHRNTSGTELDQVWTYGSWVDGGSRCDSWHNSGRAFDLSRLRRPDQTFISCRYDQWRELSGTELAAAQRSYWQVAASAHLHFAYVLTYLYDAAHANHIHLDNGRSGAGLSTFSTRSRVQVQAVQAICSHVWGSPVEVTDRWDSATQRATRSVLERIGVAGQLDDSVANWHAFLRASAGWTT